MGEFGRKADLARMLGISRSAIGQAFKKYNIQVGADGTFNLKHVECILRDKQNPTISQAQRKAIKQPAGLKNPRVKREILRLSWPIWDEAIIRVIQSRAETSFEDEEDRRDLESQILGLMSFWEFFHRIIDREIPADIGDFQFKKPPCIDFDFMKTPMLDQIKKILNSEGMGHDFDE